MFFFYISGFVPMTSHGDTCNGKVSSEYLAWTNMMRRCRDSNHPQWRYWGGAGVRVCARWHTYGNFLADMGRKPSPKHSLDRYPNNVGNYQPNNCRWATAKEQSFNKRNNRYLTAFGKTKRLTEWADECGLTYNTLRIRLFRGWDVETAITSPQGKWRSKQPKLRRAA